MITPVLIDDAEYGTIECDFQFLGPVAALFGGRRGGAAAAGAGAGAGAGSSADGGAAGAGAGLGLPNLLVVSIGACRNLKGKDSDDPYVVLKVGKDEFQTEVKDVSGD